MMNRLSFLFVASLLTACSAEDSASTTAADVVPSNIVRGARTDNLATYERAPVQFANLIDQTTRLDERPTPERVESREYWMVASATQLRQGVHLPTTAKGAMVRVSPRNAASAATVDLGRLSLVEASGVRRTMRELAGTAVATASQIQAAAGESLGMHEGTMMLDLPSLAAGDHMLQSDDPDAGDLFIHVMENQSDAVFAVRADNTAYLNGDTFVTSADWNDVATQTRDVTAKLVTADGTERPLDVTATETGYRASAELPAIDAKPGELVDVIVDTVGQTADGRTVHRTAKTSAALSLATAKIREHVQRAADKLAVNLEVGSAGRYNVSAVVVGTNASGDRVPFMMVHSARWLEPGTESLELTVDANLVAQANVSGPFELRDIRLTDQSRIALIQREAFGPKLNK